MIIQATPGIHYRFTPQTRDRETLPVLSADVITRDILFSDQIGTLRVIPGDRLKLRAVRDDGIHCLCSHSQIPALLVLTDLNSLSETELP